MPGPSRFELVLNIAPADYITEQGKLDSKKKKDLLYARYTDAKPVSRGAKAAEFVTDLEQWDAEQIAKSQLSSGALDREVIEDDYEYVFDESVKIQFALDAEDRMEGTLGAKDAALQAQIDEAERKGEIRCTLVPLCYPADTSLHPSSITRRCAKVATRL